MEFSVDGGCRGNGQPDAIGAAACFLERVNGTRYKGKTCGKARGLDDFPAPTSQRAEITAIILALKWALELYEQEGRPRLSVIIKSDSRYAVGCMTDWIYTWAQNGWTNSRGFEIANRDLIERASSLDDSVRAVGLVHYTWIPRSQNVNADLLCQEQLSLQE